MIELFENIIQNIKNSCPKDCILYLKDTMDLKESHYPLNSYNNSNYIIFHNSINQFYRPSFIDNNSSKVIYIYEESNEIYITPPIDNDLDVTILPRIKLHSYDIKDLSFIIENLIVLLIVTNSNENLLFSVTHTEDYVYINKILIV